jgi:hypothetical protein
MAIFDSLRYTIFGDSKEIKLGDEGNIDVAKRGHLCVRTEGGVRPTDTTEIE